MILRSITSSPTLDLQLEHRAECCRASSRLVEHPVAKLCCAVSRGPVPETDFGARAHCQRQSFGDFAKATCCRFCSGQGQIVQPALHELSVYSSRL